MFLMRRRMARKTVQPIALLLGSVAYLYNTFNNLAEYPGSTVIVDTTYGQLRGSRSSARNGKLFFEFLGVRKYAGENWNSEN